MKKFQFILSIALLTFLVSTPAAAVDYLVRGAGTPDVNGIYVEGPATSGYRGDDDIERSAHVYQLADANNNDLYELRYIGGCRKWMLALPGSTGCNRIYAPGETTTTPDFYLPPDALPHIWNVNHDDDFPPPSVSPITRAFGNDLLLTATGPVDIEKSNFSATWYAEVQSGRDMVFILDVATDMHFTHHIPVYSGLDVTPQTQSGSLSSMVVSGLSANMVYYYRISAYPSGAPSSAVRTNTVMVRTIPEGYLVSGAGEADVNGNYRYSGEHYNRRPVFKKYSVPHILGFYDKEFGKNPDDDEWRFVVGSHNSALNDNDNWLYLDVNNRGDRQKTRYLPPLIYSSRYGLDPPPTVAPIPLFTSTPATGIGPTGFTANWSELPLAAGYELDLALDDGFTLFITGYNGYRTGNVTRHDIDGLTSNMRYYYRARALYTDGGPDSAHSTATAVATLAGEPSAQAFSNVAVNSIRANWDGSDNPAGTQYLCQNTTAGTDSGWITNTHWDNISIRCGTGFSYRVRARNMEGAMTAWTDLSSQQTLACPPLSVEPADGLTASGGAAGPFAPSNRTYTLQHSLATGMNWSAALANNHDWVGLSPTQGTLAPGQTATVSVSINSNAASLPVGSYSETVTFYMDGIEQQSRTIHLIVLAQYSILTTASPEGAGTIILDPSGGSYLDGTSVSLEASPADAFYAFDRWEGDLSGSASAVSILMDADKNVTAVFVPIDSDGDGITDLEEASGPNGPDGNNDNTPDYLQANVASLRNQADQSYVVIVSESGTRLKACAAIANPAPDDCPDWVRFDFGFYSFTITDVPPGGKTSVTITLADGAAPDNYYKYGPMPGDPTDQWYRFKYESTLDTGATFNGNEVTLHYVDGGLGDDDLTADGVIRDPGAPGVMIGGSGNTSPAAAPAGSSGGGGGGGCWIDTLLALP